MKDYLLIRESDLNALKTTPLSTVAPLTTIAGFPIKFTTLFPDSVLAMVAGDDGSVKTVIFKDEQAGKAEGSWK